MDKRGIANMEAIITISSKIKIGIPIFLNAQNVKMITTKRFALSNIMHTTV
ncbi:hypothetical protein BN938_0093 [Mucinivorans hirudinis]|uniref:Uncharacterized protein n=1 Tax=Mucinivorans hirudinis TaxID=1433126 RepID=A0A060R5T7_9BACT|nr:hypothetical protein BN938_0093 [Mucinivorans hirudinis]